MEILSRNFTGVVESFPSFMRFFSVSKKSIFSTISKDLLHAPRAWYLVNVDVSVKWGKLQEVENYDLQKIENALFGRSRVNLDKPVLEC